MRRLWMVAAFALLAGCEENGSQVVGAERTGSAQQAPAAVGAFIVDSEPNATARLLATVQAMNQAEIAEAQLAQERASSEEVKSFARKLIDDHGRNIRDVSNLAKEKKLDVQGAINSDAFVRAKQQASQEHLQMLRGLSGAAFDAAFMAHQPANHVLLAEIAEQAQSLSNDSDVDAFFAATRRDALAHRDHAQKALPAACGGQMQPGQDQGPGVIQPGGQGAPGSQGAQPGGQGAQGTQMGGQGTQGMQLQGQGAQSGPMGGDQGGTVGGHGTRGGEGALRGDQRGGDQGAQQRDQGTAPRSPVR